GSVPVCAIRGAAPTSVIASTGMMNRGLFMVWARRGTGARAYTDASPRGSANRSAGSGGLGGFLRLDREDPVVRDNPGHLPERPGLPAELDHGGPVAVERDAGFAHDVAIERAPVPGEVDHALGVDRAFDRERARGVAREQIHQALVRGLEGV